MVLRWSEYRADAKVWRVDYTTEGFDKDALVPTARHCQTSRGNEES